MSNIIFFNSKRKYRVEDVLFFEGIVLDRGLKGQGVKEFQSEAEIEDETVRKLKPGKIIPIHTFHPDRYGDLFNRKIEQLSDGKVFLM